MTIDRDFLDTLHEQEWTSALANSPRCAPNGVVDDIRALYSDKVRIGDHDTVAFHRPLTPLFALPFLASRVVVFIPPLPRKKLEVLLGQTSFDLMVRLIADTRVIPVIGFPADYGASYCSYLTPVLHCPYVVSMPARGYALVHAMKREALFEAGARDPRLASMAGIDVVRNRWATEYPHERATQERLRSRVIQELVNNYIDLCIFGYDALADEILAVESPADRALLLLRLSELLTYPSLIGMDGRAHYCSPSAEDGSFGLRPEIERRVLSLPVVRLLFEGAGLQIDMLASDPDRYVEVLTQVASTQRLEEIARAYDRLSSQVLDASSLDHEGANEAAHDLLRRIGLINQEVVAAVPSIKKSADVLHTSLGIGAAVLGALSPAVVPYVREIGWEYAVLYGAVVGNLTYRLTRWDGLKRFVERHVARHRLSGAHAFSIWSLRSSLDGVR